MRRSKPMRIGDLWAGFVDENPRISQSLSEAKVPEVWSSVVGPAVASLTRSVEVKQGVLYVYMSSSVARQEMFMRREELKDKINKELAANVIRTVIVK